MDPETLNTLYQEILLNPLVDEPRLLYADYLDRAERHQQAEFIRTQIEEARAETGDQSIQDWYELKQKTKDLAPGEAELAAWYPHCARVVGRFGGETRVGLAGGPYYEDMPWGHHHPIVSERSRLKLQIRFRRGFPSIIRASMTMWRRLEEKSLWADRKVCLRCYGIGMHVYDYHENREFINWSDSLDCSWCNGKGFQIRPLTLDSGLLLPITHVWLENWAPDVRRLEDFDWSRRSGLVGLRDGHAAVMLRKDKWPQDVETVDRLLAAEWPGISFNWESRPHPPVIAGYLPSQTQET